MTHLKFHYLIFLLIILSCKNTNSLNLEGVYSEEGNSTLELQDSNKFQLTIANSSLEINNEPIKLSGNYKVNNEHLFLNIEKTNQKPFTIEKPALTKTDGYEFMIRGKNWGGLSGVYCKLEQDGKLVREVYSNKQGLVKFDFTNSGILTIQKEGWEKAEINLIDLTAPSFIITLEKENYKKALQNYSFLIKGEILEGLNENKNWKFKKTTK